MTRDQFLKLFPMKVEITMDIIRKANIRSRADCVGALALKKGIGDEKIISELKPNLWGNREGLIKEKNNRWEPVVVTTTDKIPMMEVTQPITVIFEAK